MKKSKIFWGIFFVLAAVFLIVGKLGFLESFGFFSLMWTVVLIAWLIVGISHLSGWSTIFPLAFLYLQYDDFLGLPELNTWIVLLSAFFLCIGISILFGKFSRFHFVPHFDRHDRKECVDGSYLYFKNNFGTATKYINSDDLKDVTVENSFGEIHVYFDGAHVLDEACTVNVSNSFGELHLYFPAGWNVNNNLDQSFGDMEYQGRQSDVLTTTVNLKGTSSFGDVVIHYI